MHPSKLMRRPHAMACMEREEGGIPRGDPTEDSQTPPQVVYTVTEKPDVKGLIQQLLVLYEENNALMEQIRQKCV